MANNTVRHINIIGHQNPDTDSICSALAYAWLKNRGSLTGLYEARRAGHVNRETRFVLQHFGVEPPRLCTDVSPQIKDIDIRKQAGIDGEMSLRAAWNLMRDSRSTRSASWTATTSCRAYHHQGHCRREHGPVRHGSAGRGQHPLHEPAGNAGG